jgi:hypothetical protein
MWPASVADFAKLQAWISRIVTKGLIVADLRYLIDQATRIARAWWMGDRTLKKRGHHVQ